MSEKYNDSLKELTKSSNEQDKFTMSSIWLKKQKQKTLQGMQRSRKIMNQTLNKNKPIKKHTQKLYQWLELTIDKDIKNQLL